MKPPGSIRDRLMTSIRYGAINGDAFERSVVARQTMEAVEYIDSQARQIEALKEIVIQEHMRDNYSCIKIDRYDPIEYHREKITREEACGQLEAEYPEAMR